MAGTTKRQGRRRRRLSIETLEPRLALTGVVINEFLASNSSGLADEDGDQSDWIELYNSNAEAVNLGGWYLTDSQNNLTKWQLPSVSLGAGDYLVVFASGKDRAVAGGQLHTNFSLAAEGEYLGLVQPDGVTIVSQFSPTFPTQRSNISYGIGTQVTETQLVGVGTIASALTPTDGTLGTAWTLPLFVPGPSWQSGPVGVGFTDQAEPPASTTVLQVDFNRRGATGPADTQPGFSSFVIGGSSGVQFGSVTRSFNGVNVTLTDVSGLGYDDRLRTTPTDIGAFTEGALLRDFVFSRDDSGTSGFDVTIDGLTPGETYTLTVWSFDTGSGGMRVSDWTANGLVAAASYAFDGNAFPTSNDTYRFGVVVSADSQGKIKLEGRKSELANNFSVFLNALRIETGNTLHPPAGIDDVLRVDFNSRAGGAVATEAGYSSMSLDENSAVIDGVTVSVSAFGSSFLDDRDRVLPAPTGSFSLSQVYTDHILSNGPAGSGIEILLSGLAPNARYDLALRSYDPAAAGPRQSAWTEVTSGQVIAAPYVFDGAVAPSSNDNNVIRATLVSSPEGTLLLRGVQMQSNRSVVVNALELTRADYRELIGLDLEANMHGQSTSAYIRAPFTVTNLAAVDQLFLDMRYDSGFVAYLNGQEVARRNAPTAPGVPPAYNSNATHERTVAEALFTETINLSAFKSLLVQGSGNVLAIHGLKSSTADGDFLIVPELRTAQVHGQSLRYFATPTPGAANGTGYANLVESVTPSAGHGFFSSPFLLELFTPTDGSQIYFTYDGSIPAPTNPAASLYTEPIIVDRTTVFRARAFKDDHLPSPVATQTYIFLDDVLAQTIDPNNPANNPFGLSYPAIWQANATGNYNVNQQIAAQWDDFNPANADFGIREGLMSIPTMSIVMDHQDLWNQSTGIYVDATRQGDAWRRAGSIEYFDPNSGQHFQHNVGVQMHGAASRDNVRLKKHSFRLIFNPIYDGPGRLEFPLFDGSDFADINTVVLKAAFTDSFATRTATGRYSPLDSTYTRDVWTFDSQRAMGSLSPDATYVHLYINGLYWGLYYPTERIDDASLASRIGGNREDWDVIKDFNELFRGDKTAWNQMFSLARQITSHPNPDAIYFALQGRNPDGSSNPSLPVYLDVENLIDYMILHLYAGAEDWPSHNWVAARNRVDPGAGFQFFAWDQEIVLDGRFRDRVNNVNLSFTPGELYTLLRNSPEFRLHFADRVQKHLFNDGALTTEASGERWMQRANQIEAAIIGESARWGDARAGEVVNVPPTATVPVMTVDHWRASVAEVMGYFPQSHALALSRFTSAGLYTSLGPPIFSQFGGAFEPGFALTLTKPSGSPGSAAIYYTLDGSDPRLPGGGLSPAAILYNGPITLEATTQVQARIRNGATWSAVVDATFIATQQHLVGDYDGNGVVNHYDYSFWRSSFGQAVEPGAGADGNGDGVVDAADYILWRKNLPRAEFSFNSLGQTYTQDFNVFRGTDATLPNHFTMTAVGGVDIFRGVFDSTTSTAASFTGIMAATSDGGDYSISWRESTGAASLDDARLLFTFVNNTGETITGFDVSFDVEAWVNGRRENQVRFKYDIYPDSAASQAAAGRQAFETDIFATPNPNHTPIATNGQQFVLDGKDDANRVTVSGFVDLTTLLINENNPGAGVFGPLLPGQVAYFRWQISNGLLLDGNRSALGIDNVSITPLGQMPASASVASAMSEPAAAEVVAGGNHAVGPAMPAGRGNFSGLSSRTSPAQPALQRLSQARSAGDSPLIELARLTAIARAQAERKDRDIAWSEFRSAEEGESELVELLAEAACRRGEGSKLPVNPRELALGLSLRTAW